MIRCIYRLAYSSCRLCILVQACDAKKHFAWHQPVGGTASAGKRLSHAVPLPHMRQQLAAWRCGCPARRAHATAKTPYSTSHPVLFASPNPDTFTLFTLGLRDRRTQDDNAG